MPVDIKEKDVALLAVIETTEGVSPAPSINQVLYATEIGITKQETLIQRDYRRADRPLDQRQQALRDWWEFSATLPYSYSGTSGAPSPLETIFLMCGLNQTVTPGTHVRYSRAPLNDFDSATLYIHTPLADGSLSYIRQVKAARGQLGFRIAVGEDITFSVSGIGNYREPYSGSTVNTQYQYTPQQTNLFGAPRPELVRVKTLDGHTICLTSVEATNFAGYDIEYHEDMCSAGTYAKDSDTPGNLTITMAMPDWDNEFNPFALANRAELNTVPFILVVGLTSGQILEIRIDEVQVGEPREVSLSNGMRGMTLNLAIVHNPRIIEL